MSSAIYLKPLEPIDLQAWREFCDKNDIVYSPNTIGQNVFYKRQVEIHFGDFKVEELPRLDNGSLDFTQATPYVKAMEICVSSFWGQNLEEIVMVAKCITEHFKTEWRYTCDPELRLECIQALKV